MRGSPDLLPSAPVVVRSDALRRRATPLTRQRPGVALALTLGLVLAFGLPACRGRPTSVATDASAPMPSVVSVPVVTAPSESAPTVPPVATAAAVPLPPPPSATAFPLFKKTTLAVDEVAKLVAAAPELARVGTEVSYFDPGDGSYIVRSSADHTGVVFTTQPLLWSPEAGQQVLVVAARGKAASFVAAWWVLPEGGYRLASSFVMLGEIAPVALAYRPAERALSWTTCWLCPGETGHVSVREDHHIVIVQD